MSRAPSASARLLSLAALALAGAAGCAGTELEGRARGVADLTRKARDNGAYNCAPHQLAMAETYLDLTQNDLHDGDYFDARNELAIADSNAKVAFQDSPKEQCNPDLAIKTPPPPPPPPKVVIERKDTDGDGLYDDVDKCPTEPEDKDGFEDADGCPDPDNDQDGIPDAQDKCPNQPEDKDGFEDADGCPDPDNDKDGIPDTQDKCPNQPGPAPDGCPQYTKVVITKEKIEILQQVFFDTDKATIKPESFPLLDEVAQAMKDHPDIQLVEVQGHTDTQGSHHHNMKLSQARAESVRAYLVKAGVDDSRLTAKGYGPDVPIADNRTAAGRAKNRRVEFVILKQENQENQ